MFRKGIRTLLGRSGDRISNDPVEAAPTHPACGSKEEAQSVERIATSNGRNETRCARLRFAYARETRSGIMLGLLMITTSAIRSRRFNAVTNPAYRSGCGRSQSS